MSLEIPDEEGNGQVEVWIDDDGYVCFTDADDDDVEFSFSPFNWRVVVAWVEQKQRERMH